MRLYLGEEAQRMIATLQPYIARGVPVVGLEPSCLFSLRDEFLSLLPGAAMIWFVRAHLAKGFTLRA